MATRANESHDNFGFEEADRVALARRNSLYQAIRTIDPPDCHLAALLLLIFRETHSGASGETFTATLNYIASCDGGCYCSVRKVQTTIALAQSYGFVRLYPMFDAKKRRLPNGYDLDWDVIHRAVGEANRTHSRTSTPCHGPSTIDHGHSTIDHGHSTPCHGPSTIDQAKTPFPVWEPGGETPSHACARAPSVHTDDKPSTSTVCSEVDQTAADPDDIREKAVMLKRALWPEGRVIADKRDQRLVYRLALLRLDPLHSGWVGRLVEATADNRPKNPLAWLQKAAPTFAPPGTNVTALLSSIDVPMWALHDTRHWAPNAECVLRE